MNLFACCAATGFICLLVGFTLACMFIKEPTGWPPAIKPVEPELRGWQPYTTLRRAGT